MQKPRIRFGVIGLNHGHINSQTSLILKAGGELAWVYAKEPDLLADFQKRFPQATVDGIMPFLAQAQRDDLKKLLS